MEKLIVKVSDPTCPLDSVELEYEWAHVKAKGPDGLEREFTVRYFLPSTVNGGRNPIEFYIERLAEMHEVSDGAEREFYGWILRTLAAGSCMCTLDQKYDRKFSVGTLAAHANPKEQTTFDSMRKTIGAVGITNLELMIRLSRGSSEAVGDLVGGAIYEKPLISTLLSESRHLEFKEQMIDDVLALRAAAHKFAREEVKLIERQIRSDQSLSAREKREALSYLRRNAPAGINRIVAESLEEITTAESEYTERFRKFVDEARCIHDEVSPYLDSAGMIAADGKVCGEVEAVRTILHDRLDTTSVNVLIDGVLVRLREVHGLTAADLSAHKDGTEVGNDNEDAFAIECHHILSEMRESNDPLDKWDAVCLMLVEFVNRNESARLFQREYDKVFLGMFDGVYREIYKAIRKTLTRAERRLFLLMYCALPGLGGRVALVDVPIQSFFWGMDDETQGLIMLVSVFGIRSWGSEVGLDKELDRRFKAFLKFYPYWVIVTRDDEKEAQHEARHFPRQDSIWEEVPHKEDGGILREQLLTGNENKEDDLLTVLVKASSETVRDWIEKYCRPTDVPRMIKRFELDMNEQAIADQEGVTQQAISLTLIRGCREVRAGLIRDNPEFFENSGL